MELLLEIYTSLKQHKTRTILTGFGVAWGIFILIILVAAGRGLQTGVSVVFNSFAQNSVWVFGGTVSQAKQGGLPEGTKIEFDDEILNKIKTRYPEITYISPEARMGGSNIASYGRNTGSFDIRGVSGDYAKIKTLEIDTGRAMNPLDMSQQRRAVVIGSRVRKSLFGNETAVGKFILISGMYFKVVGVLKEGTLLSNQDQNAIFMPITTMRSCFNTGRKYTTFAFLLNGDMNIDPVLRSYISRLFNFNEFDMNAVYIADIKKQVKAFNSLFSGLNIFLWVIGLCLLLTGMIGIGNIMLVVVKERTTEIGIRKAVGATPKDILMLIITESLLISTVFGIIGMLFGLGGVNVYNWIVGSFSKGNNSVFAHANIDFSVVLTALFLLILSGTLAGVFPAKKAASILPVKALNNENENA